MGSNKMLIYGYSKTFGLGDHELAKKIILAQAFYKSFQIETSNEGY